MNYYFFRKSWRVMMGTRNGMQKIFTHQKISHVLESTMNAWNNLQIWNCSPEKYRKRTKNRSIHYFFPPNCLRHQYLSWAIYFLQSLYKRISKNIRRLFHKHVCLSEFCLWHNFVYGCLRELLKLATCGL